jgi:hypothetical protein
LAYTGREIWAVSTEVELVRGLFVARERWGWEYVDPAPAAELDEARRPMWLEPPGPVAESRTRSWQDTASRSQAESTMTGETRSRVYEFAVEPTTIQALPVTAFILVETGGSGRQVVLGDCNPGICLYDRVAADGRPALMR